jgi:excisionase family DNA binding protein
MSSAPNPLSVTDEVSMNTTAHDVMITSEVASFLRLDRKTVYLAAARGEIPCRRIGRRILFSRRALVAWLEAQSHSVQGDGNARTR